MWTAGSRLTVSVDLRTFNYSASIQGGSTPWLTEGAVALQCGGERYATNGGHALVGSGATKKISGQDATLGPYQGVERAWRAGSCAELLTTIRYYSELDAFDFLTRLGSGGANGTATSPLSVRQTARLGRPVAINTSTEFPSFVLPPAGSAAGLGFVSWNGDALLGMHQLERPAGPGQSADFSRWTGGLVSGPMLMFANGSSPKRARADAIMLGASSAFKVGVLSRSGTRLVAGAQGMVQALPPGYELRFALAGGTGVGVTAAAYAWGRVLRRSHGAAPTAAKLSLADDVLSRALHYETDGGAAENYCDYWPMCTNASSPQWPCEPMGRTLARLDAYHRSLSLSVSLYHNDPFWWSHEPFGGCAGGSSAANLSASPFHFPAGLAAVGLPMMLIVKFFAPANVYASPPFDVRFRGLSVGAADAAPFWRARLDELVGAANLRALVWDGLDSVWLSDDARVNGTDEQAAADQAFADAALARGLPIRMDTAAPGDLLASVARGAHTVSRCTADANPHPWFETTRWVQLGDNSLLLAALGLRPMVDVLWTNATQTADPRWATGSSRPNMAHDAITAVLSTGPVGFGDLVGATDASLLSRATRADGTILKPAAPALRLERYYTALGGPGAEVWVAPAGPAASADPRTDERANARLDLGAVAAAAVALPSWWCVLATNVDGSSAAGRPVATSELWPTPPDGSTFLVATVERRAADGEAGVVVTPPPCEDGQPARSCLALWDASNPLGVGTGAPPSAEVHTFALFLAAPLLPSGWVLLGELGAGGNAGKYVPASPQRLLMGEDDARDGVVLRFGVLGAAAEAVQLTLVAPAAVLATSATPARAHDNEGASPLDGVVVVLRLTLGASGAANVSCAVDACSHVAF